MLHSTVLFYGKGVKKLYNSPAMLCYAMRDYTRVSDICKILLRYCYMGNNLLFFAKNFYFLYQLFIEKYTSFNRFLLICV